MGPVSKTLEHELRQFVRRNDIIIWLDADATYTDFVGSLQALQAAGELPYAVKTFRGSHLELILELETLSSTSTRHALVVHMPTFNVETVKETPLLELYLAGKNFKKRLSTLVREAATGKVLPESIEEFSGRSGLTLQEADAWLSAMLRNESSALSGSLRMMPIETLLDDLLTKPCAPGSIAARIHSEADRAAVWDRLGAGLGMPASWHAPNPTGELRAKEQAGAAEEIAFTAASWSMCAEYVDDLKRAPNDERLSPAVGLSRSLVDSCRSLAEYLRQSQTSFYKRTADETEGELAAEIAQAVPEDLGEIDTFRFEEKTILLGALQALEEGQWKTAANWATRRLDGKSFWLREEPERQSVWTLIRAAASLGQRIEQAGSSLGNVDTHDAAIKRYTEVGAAVDRAHRQLEQHRRSLLYPRLPEFDRLRDRLDAMRSVWREWADGWARDFNALCRKHGFLPGAELQQRHLFNDVVVPLASDSEPIAIFVIDAFRFEMAQELFDSLSDSKATSAHLRARLAELPTVTSVGMNALAPVERAGRLKPDIKNGKFRGFSTGQYHVNDPESRKRAMHERVGGRTCPRLSLRDVVDRDSKSLKRTIAQARLIYVHSQEIDDAGEKDLGPVVFDYAMQNIRAAWRLLREAGVKQFVFTADHGFLLRDGIQDVQSHGRKIDPTRRHVVSPLAADHRGEVRVPLADLGYEGSEDHLMFPETTAAFDIGDRSLSYLHGGNSLQERLIPVITISHRAAIGGSTQKYEVTGKALDPVGGMHCLQAALLVASGQPGLNFGGAGMVELAVRVADAENVTVELCQIRGGSTRLKGGTIEAAVGDPFELFFRLSGETDARVQVELYHPGAEAVVTPIAINSRFTVAGTRTAATVPEKSQPASEAWLLDFPEDGVRQLFQHLAKHGAVTESEAATLLGGSRKLRRFATQFESFAARAPFEIRIDVIGGVKRYVREKDIDYEV